jgi:glucose/arabinose dehydrogenase
MWRTGLTTALLTAVVLVGCGNEDGDAAQPPATSGSPKAQAAAKKSKLRLARIGRFTAPLYVDQAPGDGKRLFVVEQAGRIMILRKGHKLSKPFLDIRSKVTAGGEQGLLGLAFAPDYKTSGLFYVYYTDKDSRERLVEYTRSSANRAKASSARTVFVHDDPQPNHNGGQLEFGPDRLLYIGTGDGGGADDQHGAHGNAQNLASPLGKILRIDPRAGAGFKIPAGNPFVGRSGALGEIYSYGLRNPWRFSFDRKTGDLAIGDVGQDAVEEIDFVKKGQGAGANFGWRTFEGTRHNSNYPSESVPGQVKPVLQHTHDSGWCSITGGYVVRDPRLGSLQGKYVYGDFCKGRIYSAKLKPGGASGDGPLKLPTVQNLSSFGQDNKGRVYVTSLAGPVYRLVKR